MPLSDYRMPNSLLVTNSLSSLQSAFQKLSEYQAQASSLKRLTKPSDAPADVVSAMQLHSGLSNNTQIARNLDDAVGWLGTADNALTSVVTQLQRVNDLVIQASNASADSTARGTIAAEIDNIRASLIGVANTKFAGRAVFAGTASGGVAYQADGSYVGVSVPIERTIAPGQRIQVNVNGDDVFGTPGNDLFSTLAQISDAVRTDTSQLGTLKDTLDTQTATVQTQLGAVGARFQRVQNSQSQNTSDALTMKQNLSNVEDADLSQVMMQLQMQQVAYQAALEATARSIQPSLADFLR